MFGRRSRPGGDVVEAAQRRLAALSLSHREGIVDQSQPPPSSSEEVMNLSPPSTGSLRAGTGRDVPGGGHARHLDPREATRGRTELGRWGLTGQQVTLAAICLVLLVVLGAWWALRSVPHTDRVTLSSTHATLAGSGSGSTPIPAPTTMDTLAAAEATSGRLIVDVAGRVRHPGIVELPAGSRVVDAVAAAGGARPGVALTSLNLARPLLDGEQILVGVRVTGFVGPPPASGTSSTTAIAPLELNDATVEQLDTLPGIGPVTAQAIVQWRSDNGRFTSVNELLEVSGIGDVTLSDLRPYVYV